MRSTSNIRSTNNSSSTHNHQRITSRSSWFRTVCLLNLLAPLLLSCEWCDSGTVVLAFVPPRMRIPKTSCGRPSASSSLWAVSPQGKDWFQQQKGESDLAFIKRITSSNAPPPITDTTMATNAAEKDSNTTASTGYQRIEDWEAAQAASQAGMSWEEKVQFDGQRFGNQVRQNDILIRQINSGM